LGPERGRPGRPTQAVRHTKQKAIKFKIAPHKQNSIVKKKIGRKMGTPKHNGKSGTGYLTDFSYFLPKNKS
jgi:hypothetical protein